MTTCPKHDCPLTQNRSSADHRRFFGGVLPAVFDAWPERHDFQPEDVEHLRAWLLIKAGHRTVTPIETDCASDDQDTLVNQLGIVKAAVRAANGGAFVRLHGSQIVVFAPRSIKFNKLSRKAWNEVRESIEAVIDLEVGKSADELLREHEAAA